MKTDSTLTQHGVPNNQFDPRRICTLHLVYGHNNPACLEPRTCNEYLGLCKECITLNYMAKRHVDYRLHRSYQPQKHATHSIALQLLLRLVGTGHESYGRVRIYDQINHSHDGPPLRPAPERAGRHQFWVSYDGGNFSESPPSDKREGYPHLQAHQFTFHVLPGDQRRSGRDVLAVECPDCGKRVGLGRVRQHAVEGHRS